MRLRLKALREEGKRPRVHGNGFVQLDLTEKSRLHIWGDRRIPRQVVDTSIHDHTFGFMSTCIVGRVVNLEYSSVEEPNGGPYQVYVPRIRQGEDTVLEPTGALVRVSPRSAKVVCADTDWHKYEMQPYVFHESFTDRPSATIITKYGLTQAQGGPPPRVLCPVGQEPDNKFNRYDGPVGDLWRIIKDVLGDVCDL